MSFGVKMKFLNLETLLTTKAKPPNFWVKDNIGFDKIRDKLKRGNKIWWSYELFKS
jgi:hypothetical protein